MVPRDRYDRPLRSLRISVTDRCNLRCGYCMPEEEYRWLPRAEILRFEEIRILAEVFASLGVERIRITGGEPLVRHGLDVLVAMLRGIQGIRDLAITTNGLRLADQAEDLKRAGLTRITVSLDTLDPDRFRRLTRRDCLPRALAGVQAAAAVGLPDLKIDTVVIRGVNDDELADLLEYGQRVGAEVRFIEYMDVGGATRWTWEQVVTRDEILARLQERYGPATPLVSAEAAPADRFRLPDGTVFGIISSTSAPFCGTCDRSRLTADGSWFLCLYAAHGIDLRGPLRAGATADDLCELVRAGWTERADRGAESRLAMEERGPLADAAALRRNPHLEMHTRGG